MTQPSVTIRPFRPDDLPACAELFHQTVQQATGAAYSAAQRQAWSPSIPDPAFWSKRLAGQQIWVAQSAAGLQGFITLTDEGLIDFAFVHHAAVGRGVGKALYAALLVGARARGLTRLTTEASHIARPFFQALGFTVLCKNEVWLDGVMLENFSMWTAI
ncbi:MAG: hypothetical protein Kilf2KO_05630 [Rhodospirillales bacterium]